VNIEDAGKADLIKIPGWPEEFQDRDRLTFEEIVEVAVALWWTQRFDFSGIIFPAELASQLEEDLLEVTRAHYSCIDHIQQVVKVELSAEDGEKQNIWFQAHSIEFDGDQLHQDTMDAGKPHRGTGIGRTMMRNVCRLARRLRLSKLALMAIDAGPYVWAKHGFIPSEESWYSTLMPAALNKLEELKHDKYVETQTYDLVRKLLYTYTPEALWLLAAMTIDIFDKCTGQYIPVGRALLAWTNASWYGELPLDPDGPAFAKFEQYVGGI
jgi:hypothetical protein